MDYASAPSRLRNPSSDNDVLFRVSKALARFASILNLGTFWDTLPLAGVFA